MRHPPDAFNQHCAARQTLNLIADKWAVLLIYALAGGTKRYGELQEMIQGVTPKMLTQTLRRMEANGIVLRMVYAVVPPRVEYSLTPLGITLRDPLSALYNWAEEHAYEVEDIQANSLMLEHSKAEL